jgi:glycosyltransferase involved in cell wall biosynthesis
MKRARALVLTSWFESFGLVLVEAMACGTPTISVDCVGGPREILADGKFGLLVPGGDADAIAAAMLRLAQDDDLHRRLAHGGPARAQLFAAREIVARWQSMIEKIPRSGAASEARDDADAGDRTWRMKGVEHT